MAALGSIRKKGTILICIIGLGLFAFIAEEFMRSCEATSNESKMQVGEVLGEKINVQEFQKLVEEYTDVIKMQRGEDNLPEEQMTQIRDQVWNTFVSNKLVEGEAEKLGLTVTDTELQNILKEGTNPMLLQTPFVNQQTGRFDLTSLQKFLADYKAQQANPQANAQLMEQYSVIYRYWTFIEKTLRQQTLAQKYQALLANCFLSNPIEAKMAFNEENEESKIQLAALPYTDVQDSEVKVEESELKAKYEEMKARFIQPVESRDIKYVAVQVTASAKDRQAIQKDFVGYHAELAAAANPEEVVRKAASTVPYLGIPLGKEAYPMDIAASLDSVAVGETTAVKENKLDNTLNIMKLVAKVQLPDSIQYRLIQAPGTSLDDSKQRADSILTALQGGADFEVLAKKYGQTGEKMWMTTRQYEFSQTMSSDTKQMINTLNNATVNAYQLLPMSQGNIVIQVLDRKAMVTKYQAAVIKKTIDFSKDTYRAAYNKFSSFVSANQTAADLTKNATKSGYKVQQLMDMTTAAHNVANINSTRDALKWVFDAKKDDVSPLYECGNNDCLLVVILDDIHRVGYRGLDDAQVRDIVKAEVIRDKKAEKLIAKLNGVKSIAAAKSKGAKVMDINQVTFAAPVFVTSTGASEPALSGAVSVTKKGAFCAKPVKGQAGVYVFQVTDKTKRNVKYDQKSMESKLTQRRMQYASNFMQELYLNGKVVDNRYLFF